MVRVFIGFFTSPVVVEKSQRLREEAGGFIHGKWTQPQNLHITLQFIGEVDRQTLFELVKTTQEVASNFRPFKITYKGLGVFPHLRRPRILWVGVDIGSAPLKRLAKAVEVANRRVKNIRPDTKPFHPHVTICRMKRVDDRKLRYFLRKYQNFVFGEEVVNKIAVIKSTLTPEGPIYAPIEEFYFSEKI
ncbi:MAG: RNA 2',3'-cyclic phosphodiesterase [Gammaproteobacteria bacterium]|nr:MAG: RNA 2',3'-cyclic phosphodiesterase [Gammaproteobacteria bacterium]RTZ69626.1 MAG: RNA 2',3'-cyclic phosphodiesterase [Aquificaceae bacterium]